MEKERHVVVTIGNGHKKGRKFMNKVKFGLSNVHIAPITYSGSTVTYGTIFDLKGAVNLSLDPAGESADFYADNTKYFSNE